VRPCPTGPSPGSPSTTSPSSSSNSPTRGSPLTRVRCSSAAAISAGVLLVLVLTTSCDGAGRTLWVGAVRPGRMHDQTAIKTEGIEEPADELLPVAGSGGVKGSTRQPRDRQGVAMSAAVGGRLGGLGPGAGGPDELSGAGGLVVVHSAATGAVRGLRSGRGLLDRRGDAGQRARQPSQPTVSVAAGAVGLVACLGSLPAAWVGRDPAGFTAGKAR
jgi:hypothetical protein